MVAAVGARSPHPTTAPPSAGSMLINHAKVCFTNSETIMADLDLLPTPDLLASLLDHNAQAVAAVGPGDVVAGVVASGGTPFVLGACRGAARWPDDRHRLRAGSPLAALADLPILLDVGPEALLGSTRLKAGTAQEIAPNMISTGVMAWLGYVYGDLLVGRGPPMPSCAPAPARPRRRHPRHPHRPGSRCGRGATGPLRPRCADGATVRQAGLGVI